MLIRGLFSSKQRSSHWPWGYQRKPSWDLFGCNTEDSLFLTVLSKEGSLARSGLPTAARFSSTARWEAGRGGGPPAYGSTRGLAATFVNQFWWQNDRWHRKSSLDVIHMFDSVSGSWLYPRLIDGSKSWVLRAYFWSQQYHQRQNKDPEQFYN